jgi:hypothetical protein
VAILTRARTAWLGCAAALAGCAALAWQAAPARPAFPHAAHGEALGLECATCHETATTAAAAGRPAREGCLLCHETVDAEKPAEQHAAALFDDAGAYRAAPWNALDDEVRFAHDAHAKAGVGCAECHGDVAATTAVPASVRVHKDACLACHAARGVADRCATCHTRHDTDLPPATHGAGWRAMHGQPVRAASPAIADRCQMCHTASACTGCHATEPPRSHTNHFRQLGHGLEAAVDRARCATCHTADHCIQCHQETAPRSHTASWGGTKSTHCVSCHAGATTSCATCHPAGTPSHALATPLPTTHTPAMNCRQCHGAGQPLPHVDNGGNCVDCHK